MTDLVVDMDLLSTARVLVVGDIMLDRFRYGTVARISPEAPVPVLHITREEEMLGGAGNVLANLVSLGASAGLIAVVGDDAAGRRCSALIMGWGGDPALLVENRVCRTTLKTRFISIGQQLLRCAARRCREPGHGAFRPGNRRL